MTTFQRGSLSQDGKRVTNPAMNDDYENKLTLRIPEATHGPAGHDHDHDHEIPVKACLVPKELYDHIVEAGVAKSKWRLDKHIVMGLLAGFYIGFSFTFMMVIGGQIPGIQHGENPGLYNLILGCFGFPLGLFMICVVGADLFTSNCAYMMTAVHEGRCTLWDLVRNWTLSWFVNLAGSIIMAYLVYAAMIFDGRSEFVLYLANKKTHYTFGACLCKGLLANWLVNLAVWIANAAQDVTGKFVGIFVPISAFIAIGGEHCIANQFLFTLASLYGWDMSVDNMITKNFIPATIGNIIGGAFFVGTLYSLSLGTLFDSTYHNVGMAYNSVTGRHLPLRVPRDQGHPEYVEPTWYERLAHNIVSPHWMHHRANPRPTAQPPTPSSANPVGVVSTPPPSTPTAPLLPTALPSTRPSPTPTRCPRITTTRLGHLAPRMLWGGIQGGGVAVQMGAALQYPASHTSHQHFAVTHLAKGAAANGVEDVESGHR